MELNWSTFLLEIFNFLILIWILKRVFYVPIQKAITERKKKINEGLDKTQKLYAESNQLKEKYESRLQVWEAEKEEKMKQFQQELEAWKSKELISFEKKLKEEKEKTRVRESKTIASIIEKHTYESLLLASKFSSKFLKAFADDHLEKKIIDKFLENIIELPEEKVQLLKANIANNDENPITIQSAYVIDEIQKNSLTEKLQKLLTAKIKIIFIRNLELLAGLSIQIGFVYLQANLRDELNFFVEVAHEYHKEN